MRGLIIGTYLLYKYYFNIREGYFFFNNSMIKKILSVGGKRLLSGFF